MKTSTIFLKPLKRSSYWMMGIFLLLITTQPTETFAQTDVIEGIFQLDVGIWPNPANNLIHIEVLTEQPGSRSIALYDLQGQEVKANLEGIGALDIEDHLSINTRNLPDGIYLLKVNAGQHSTTKKFIVQH